MTNATSLLLYPSATKHKPLFQQNSYKRHIAPLWLAVYSVRTIEIGARLVQPVELPDREYIPRLHGPFIALVQL